MKVQGIKCPECEDIIYSRAHYDFHSCSCKACSIDGGTSYTRIIWDDKRVEQPKSMQLVVNATAKELYDDWNQREDNYGKIRKEKPEILSE